MVRRILGFQSNYVYNENSNLRHKVLPKLLSNGHLKIQNIDHKKGGLDAIPVGLEELKQGKVSGKKIVYTIV